MSRTKPTETPKCDLALVLHDKGVDNSAIAERLGIKSYHVNSYLEAGRKRRAARQKAKHETGT